MRLVCIESPFFCCSADTDLYFSSLAPKDTFGLSLTFDEMDIWSEISPVCESLDSLSSKWKKIWMNDKKETDIKSSFANAIFLYYD